MFKNFVGTGSWKYNWVLALGLVLSPAAWAVPTPVPFDGVDAWQLWENGLPLEVVPGAWEKLLENPNVAGGTQGTILTLNEYLKLPIGASASTWTETILSSDWIWIDGFISSDYTPPLSLVPGVLSNLDLTITFTFALQDTTQGTIDVGDDAEIELIITKRLQCVAADRCADSFLVVENAVPEPGTLLLLGAGLAGFALRRRRLA